MTEIPEPLRSTLETLRRAFPAGVPEDEYLPLLAVLGETMSHRSTSQVIVALTGSEWAVAYNDVLRALSMHPQDSEVAARVRARLASTGYDPEAT